MIYGQSEKIDPLMLVIYGAIILVALISIFIAYRKLQEEKEGQPMEDEFTNLIKYKSGYFAYIASMYMWLFLFLFRDFMPNIETMVGGGILLSAIIGFISKMIIKQHPDVQ